MRVGEKPYLLDFGGSKSQGQESSQKAAHHVRFAGHAHVIVLALSACLVWHAATPVPTEAQTKMLLELEDLSG